MLQLKHIRKEYHTGKEPIFDGLFSCETGDGITQTALDDVSLNFRDSEFVAVLGPSGSGKTTLLNIIGGLDHADSGELLINGKSTKQYNDRDWDSYRNHTIGFIFQSYNLILHQTILANVELALTIAGVSREERKLRATKALEDVGLGDQLNKKPNQLSGGQMQRVAIARALVNDPDILLADEPTGALDSETSIQVMDLLQEVAKDKLVIMVTHNPDLAGRYATRIVQLKDGKIINDSNPYQPEPRKLMFFKDMNTTGKASMSFLTSLGLSFRNLLTKKTRTILTAFAGSIGIVGIALILSLSTGVNNYIAEIEEDTLSEYPIEITNTGFDLSSMMNMATDTIGDFLDADDDADIKVTAMMTSMFTQVESNDLSSLKDYLDSGESDIDDYTQAIEYSYNATPYIFVENDDGSVSQVNPSTMMSQMGMSNSMIQNYINMDMFHILPENDSLYTEQYDLEAGRWPEDYTEGVLVLSSTGGLSDIMLYSLGLRDSSELDEMISDFLNGETIGTPNDMQESFSYDEILGLSFKLVSSSDFYSYDEDVELWIDKSDNMEYMETVVKNGDDLNIVGIVKPSEDATATFLTTGVYFPYAMIEYMAEEAEQSEIVQAQLENPDINVLTGEKFGDDASNAFNMSSILNIDEDAIAEMMEDAVSSIDVSDFESEAFLSLDIDSFDFSFDSDSFDTDFSNLDLEFDMDAFDISSMMDMSAFDMSNLNVEMPALDISSMNMASLYSTESLNTMMKDLYAGYLQYSGSSSGLSYDLQKYLNSTEGSALLNSYIQRIASGYSVNAFTMASAIVSGYSEYAAENNLSDIESMTDSFSSYLESAQAKSIMAGDMRSLMDMDAFYESLDTMMQSYMTSYNAAALAAMQQQMAVMIDQISDQLQEEMEAQLSEQLGAVMSDMMDQMEEQMTSAMNDMMEEMSAQLSSSMSDMMGEMTAQMTEAMSDMFSLDDDTMSEIFDFNLDSVDLMDVMSSISLSSNSSYNANLEALGYIDFSSPSEIDIYPLDFDSKENVTLILEDYNNQMSENGEEEKMISYTDFVGTLMSSVTDIINLISYVLIAFVSISLIVSSIMIGVITYISVLERKKEIGILRAMGASQNNVSQVFTAETFIIGFCSGLMGVILSRLILIPANAIIHLVSGSTSLHAVLPIGSSILLVLLSIVLTVIGGLIPSRSAAKSDPVAALRSD